MLLLSQTSSYGKTPFLYQVFHKTTLPVRGDWILVISSQGQVSGDEIDMEMQSVSVELSLLTNQQSFVCCQNYLILREHAHTIEEKLLVEQI